MNAAVSFFNEILNQVQYDILKINKSIIFDLNRKRIGKKIVENGQNTKSFNLKLFH